jgi:galactose mutarotase-like enzyme
MSFRQTSVTGFPAIALAGDEIEVVAVPSLGMKLTNLRRPRGREWLWRSSQIALAPGVPGASYVDTADSGGWDECFPTVGACPMPGRPDIMLPDHGELWSAPWNSSVYEGPDGTTLAAATRGRLLPYEFQREVTADPHEPVVHLRYRLRNTGDAAFPWIWSSHPLWNVQPGTTLDVPGMTQVKVDAVHGRDDLARNDMVSWPGGIADGPVFTFPPPTAGWAMKVFGDVGPEGRMVLTDPRQGERLELRVAQAEVPQVGIWINCAGWAPPGKQPYYNLALEPCIGAPDRLDQAVEEWHMAQTLAPGEERRWSVSARLPSPRD